MLKGMWHYQTKGKSGVVFALVEGHPKCCRRLRLDHSPEGDTPR
jgi:hypothetical protein